MAVYSVNNSNGRFTLSLTLTESNPSTNDNSSLVSYKLQLRANTAWDFINYNITKIVVLDNETVHNETKKYSSGEYNTITLAEGSKTITHDADGSKNLSFSYSINMTKVDYTPGPLSSSGTMTLTSIARAAEVTSATSFNDEQNPTLSFTNPGGYDVMPYFNVYDKYTNALVYSFSENLGQYSSPHTIAIPDWAREQLRNAANNANEYKAYIGVKTVIGANEFWDSDEAVFSIVNAKPNFTADQFSYEDTNPTTKALTESDGQGIVSGKSVIGVSFGAATGNKGATISKYEVTVGNIVATISSDGSSSYSEQIGTVISNNDLTLYVKAIDSRGNFETIQKTVTIFPYSEPQIAYHSNYDYIECTRCDEDGTIARSGEHLKIAIQGRWSAFPNGKNIGKLQVMYSTKDTDSQWYDLTTTDTVGDSSNLYVTKGDFNDVAEGVILNKSKSHTITIRCIDSLGKVAKVSYKIPTQKVDLHLRKGVAIGKYVENEDMFEVDYDSLFNKSINGTFIKSKGTYTGADSITIQTHYTEFTSEGSGSRQTIFMFGAINGLAIYGLIFIHNEGTVSFYGNRNDIVFTADAATGRIVMKFPQTAYDGFTFISATDFQIL